MKKYNKEQQIYSLNKGWRFLEKDITVLPPTKQHDDVYGFAKAGAHRGPADANFDDSDWETVNLPHDWVTKHNFVEDGSPNQGYKERGIGWYRMRFELPEEDRNKQILLEFEGMSCDASVYVNGSILKHSYSGYNSFCVDMTDMANFGVIPNTVAIRIDASAWEGWWYEGAGIYRNVWLVKKSEVHLAHDGVFIKPEFIEGTRWNVSVSAELENSFEHKHNIEAITSLYGADGNLVGEITLAGKDAVEGYETVTVAGEMEVNSPTLWSDKQPYQYKAVTKLYEAGVCIDETESQIGFRTISIDAEKGFWLNGENIKLKGFCNHQDHAGVGVAVPYSIKEYRMRLLQELGANAYRCAHNPDPEILDICDALGIMVMVENRTYSSSEETLREIEGIVRQSRNHPCVILYSVFNEEPLQGTHKGRRMAGAMQAAVKRVDNTRPVLGAFNGGYMEEEGASTILDVTGINYNPARYDEFHKKYPNTPLIGSETASAFMVRGEYATDYEKHIINSYDDEAALWGNTIREAWKMVVERPFVAGTFVWTGFDYRGEPTPFVWPSVATFFGTYDSCGFEKDACYFYKAYWKQEPIVHLVSPWVAGHENGESIRVKVVTNCEEVAILVNDQILDKKSADPIDHVEFTVPYEAGELMAVGYRKGEVVANDTQVTAEKPDELQVSLSQESLKADGFDAVAVNVCLVDSNGTVIPNADDVVTFEVENGLILGVGNGNPNSHEDDISNVRKLYHGKAQAILAPTGKESVKVTVKVSELSIQTEVVIPVVEVESFSFVEPVEERILDNWRIYYQLFDEMPNPNPKVDKNDMNSFEPITFNGAPQTQLTDQLHKYALYRCVSNLGEAKENRYLYISDIKGYAWIYLNGELLESRTDSFGGHMIVNLPKEAEGEQVITVVIHNENVEWPQAGICSPVVLKEF
ncbi:beta-galactosidase GalA [Anaerosporobacter sp.]|uniref:beta-galactosidase GalA n=1 Tax=Anaerosporobacter sp. TaxID=1872529 RepID=UPI00286F4244|nr:beta-galactosidase GalA [Anaerosporobacter sp.]